jgi:hypothetical protein
MPQKNSRADTLAADQALKRTGTSMQRRSW